MKPLLRCMLIPTLLLLASAPWAFIGGTREGMLGLPVWVLCTLGVAFAYAVAVAWLMHKHWGDMEE